MSNRLRNMNKLAAVPAALAIAMGSAACSNTETEPKEAVVTVTETPSPSQTVEASPTETPSATPEDTSKELYDEALEVKSAAEFNEKYRTARQTKDMDVDQFTDLVNTVQLDKSEMKNESTIATALAKGIAARDRAIFASGFDMPEGNEDYYRSQGSLNDSAEEFNRDARNYISIENRVEDIYPYSKENEIHNLAYKEPYQVFVENTWGAFTRKYAERVLKGDRANYNVLVEVDPESLDFNITKAGNVTISATSEVYDNIPQGESGNFYDNPSATSYTGKVEGEYDQATGELVISKREITEFKTAEEATNMIWPDAKSN